MRSEKEKMLAGELYDPLDSQLSAERRRARLLCKLDQIRTVDKTRLVRRLGKIEKQTRTEVLSVLEEMFAP